MSKELEALEQLKAITKFDGGKYHTLGNKKEIKIIENALKRLEALDNSNPSQALECLENAEKEEEFDVVSQHYDYQYLLSEEAVDTIKQYILKSQEIKKENTELKQTLALFKQKLEDTDNIKVATIMMKQLDTNTKLEKENEILKEIIRSFFDRGCPLHQYIDKNFGLAIEIDNECSTMVLGEYKGIDLDKYLKEVLENE